MPPAGLPNKGSSRDAPKMGLPFDLMCAVTIGVHYLGRPLVRCTQNGYIGHNSRKKVASV